jgi:hypothetical protein
MKNSFSKCRQGERLTAERMPVLLPGEDDKLAINLLALRDLTSQRKTIVEMDLINIILIKNVQVKRTVQP